MNASWLYQQNPFWIVAVLAIVMIVTAEIGFHAGRRWHPRSDDERRGHLGLILGSLLGLLALLLSFTFAMAANRYDLRRQLVVDGCGLAEGLYLYSSLLPDDSRKPFKQSLRKYVTLRSHVARISHELSPEETSKLSLEAEALHHEMWQTARDSAAATPPRFADIILKVSLMPCRFIAREYLVGKATCLTRSFGCFWSVVRPE